MNTLNIRVWDAAGQSTDLAFQADMDDEDDLSLGILDAVYPIINQGFTHFVKWNSHDSGTIMERWDLNETNEILRFQLRGEPTRI